MSIDDKVRNEDLPEKEVKTENQGPYGVSSAKGQGPYCFSGGKYHYRSSGGKDQKGLFYCALSEDRCPYYQLIKGKEICKAYAGGK